MSNASIASSTSFLNSTTNHDLNDITNNDLTVADSTFNNTISNSIMFDSSESSLVADSLPNSIHNLVKNVNYKKKSTTTGLLSINSTSTVISLNGPTSKDIPPTKLSVLENVPDSYFDGYLSNLDPYYDEFNDSKSLTSSSLKTLDTPINKISMVALNEEQEAMLDSNNLSNVPEFYFDQNFRLDNPRIFNKVIENTHFLSLVNDGATDIDNDQALMIDHEALQEKLSSYLDIIEVHLIHEISKSSDNFFSALDDLKSITNSSKLLKDRLKNVDSNLSKIKASKIGNARNLITSIKKYQNIEKFNQILIQIKTILNQSDLAEVYYYKGEYDKSLQLIDSVFALIRGNVPPHPIVNKLVAKWKFPLKDLNKLPALSPLKRLLSNLISDTGKSYAKLFANYLIDDLRSSYENVHQVKILKRLLYGNINTSNNNNDKYRTIQNQDSTKMGNRTGIEIETQDGDGNQNSSVISDEFKLTISIYLKGLTRCGELSSAFKLYEERLINELKSIFKSNLPSDTQAGNISSNKSDDSRSTSVTANINNALILSDLVKNMTPKEFENMLVNNYTKFSETFKRLTLHQNLLLNLSIDALNNFDSQILKVQPDIIMDLDITNSINSSINSIQRRMAKVIKIREQQNSFIPLNYFLRFYRLNLSFLRECEIVSKGMINDPILKDVIYKQLMLFIQQFHKSSLKRCIELIETETWKDDGLSIESQQILDLIIKASDGSIDESEWTAGLSLNFEDYDDSNSDVNDNSRDSRSTATSSAAVVKNNTNDASAIVPGEIRKTLNIHLQNYILPPSITPILGTLKAYLLLIHYFKNNINSIISQNYLPELLKAINLKIHQSILGAQATKTAGLKHVTTKHLALAAEVCRFWGVVVADVERACLSELDSNNNSSEEANRIKRNIMKEFEEVRGLFGEQVVDVYDKLVAIMRDTVLAITQGLSVANFTNSSDNSNKANPYIESIVKKTLTIARSVQRYLPVQEYDGVMIRIFAEYERILVEKYTGIMGGCADGDDKMDIVRRQIFTDMMFFKEKLDDLNGADTVDRILIAVGCEQEDSATSVEPETEKVEAEQPEAEKVEAEKVEAEKVEAEKVEAEKVEAEKVEAEKVEAEEPEAEMTEKTE